MKGHVYKLTSKNGLIYIGSTTKPLRIRLLDHRSAYKLYKKGGRSYISSFDLYENIEDIKKDISITLIETVDFDSKLELQAKECEHIKNNTCVNIYIPRASNSAKYESMKIAQKKYKQANKEYFKKYYQQYQKLHPEAFAKSARKYYEKNREKILAKKKQQWIQKKTIVNDVNNDAVDEAK
jgi:glycerophosphoryl diester phosphodiesterase